MEDIKLLEKCPICNGNLTLMESISSDTYTLWLVKRCLNCHSYPVEEVIKVCDHCCEK